jgi:hypothetical protein
MLAACFLLRLIVACQLVASYSAEFRSERMQTRVMASGASKKWQANKSGDIVLPARFLSFAHISGNSCCTGRAVLVMRQAGVV